MKKIRAKSVCLFRHKGKVLLAEAYDPVKKEHFVMPIGGGIEFGETSETAAKREVQEEIGAVVTDMSLLGVSENIFSFEGNPGHEVVFVYEGRFEDTHLYQQEVIHGIESNGTPLTLRWFETEYLKSDKVRFYPHGIQGMLPSDTR